jgi:hypothetical protein
VCDCFPKGSKSMRRIPVVFFEAKLGVIKGAACEIERKGCFGIRPGNFVMSAHRGLVDMRGDRASRQAQISTVSQERFAVMKKD